MTELCTLGPFRWIYLILSHSMHWRRVYEVEIGFKVRKKGDLKSPFLSIALTPH